MKPKKRRKPFAANNASRKLLEADGWCVTTVEQNIPKCFIKRDAFGFGDLLCCSPSKGIMLVQATGGTSTSNFHSRIAKLRAEPKHALWLAAGGRIQVHSHERIKGKAERPVRVLEITSLAPTATQEMWKHSAVLEAVNACCSCGGKGPDDGCCQACEVWHRLNHRWNKP